MHLSHFLKEYIYIFFFREKKKKNNKINITWFSSFNFKEKGEINKIFCSEDRIFQSQLTNDI